MLCFGSVCWSTPLYSIIIRTHNLNRFSDDSSCWCQKQIVIITRKLVPKASIFGTNRPSRRWYQQPLIIYLWYQQPLTGLSFGTRIGVRAFGTSCLASDATKLLVPGFFLPQDHDRFLGSLWYQNRRPLSLGFEASLWYQNRRPLSSLGFEASLWYQLFGVGRHKAFGTKSIFSKP